MLIHLIVRLGDTSSSIAPDLTHATSCVPSGEGSRRVVVLRDRLDIIREDQAQPVVHLAYIVTPLELSFPALRDEGRIILTGLTGTEGEGQWRRRANHIASRTVEVLQSTLQSVVQSRKVQTDVPRLNALPSQST